MTSAVDAACSGPLIQLRNLEKVFESLAGRMYALLRVELNRVPSHRVTEVRHGWIKEKT